MQQEWVLNERPGEDGVAFTKVHGQLGNFYRRISQRLSYALEVCFTTRFKDADVLALRQDVSINLPRALCNNHEEQVIFPPLGSNAHYLLVNSINFSR